MSRRFLAGAVWGSLVAGLGLAIASQLYEPPKTGVASGLSGAESPKPEVVLSQPAPETKAETAPAASAPEGSQDGTALVTKDAPLGDAAPLAAVPEPASPPQGPANSAPVPVAVLPAPPELPAAPNTDVAAGAVLEQVSPDLVSPLLPEATPEQAQAGMTPLVPPESAELPRAGQAAPLQTTPSRDAAPAAIIPDPAPKLPQAKPTLAPVAASEPAPAPADLPPQPEDTPAPTEEPQVAQTETPTETRPEPTSELPSVILTPVVPAPVQPTPVQPETAEAAAAPVLRPSPGFRAPVEGVTTGRLPSIGAAEPAEPAEPSLAPVATDDVAVAEDTRPAIDRFSRPFENPAAKPLFAIVLLDTGESTLDRKALAALPFPVSFALDPTAPGAQSAAQIYRDAGQEVVMLASAFPEGATAADLEVTLAAHSRVLPQAVAVLDEEAGGFQGNRMLAAMVLPIVADQGRGLLSWDRGLNAASQIARRDGVRSATIFRRLDGEDEANATIRRYLDRAAFKAAQDGRVIVAGNTRPETVAALLEWAVEGRAATVALAPVTAVMTAQ